MLSFFLWGEGTLKLLGLRSYLLRVALALEGAAEVVYNDARAALREEEGVGLAEATTGAGDDDDLAVIS